MRKEDIDQELQSIINDPDSQPSTKVELVPVEDESFGIIMGWHKKTTIESAFVPRPRHQIEAECKKWEQWHREVEDPTAEEQQSFNQQRQNKKQKQIDLMKYVDEMLAPTD